MLDRVKKLRNLRILDTGEEEMFNEIVETASMVCEVPISLITLLDEERQWFKAKLGTDVQETPVSIAFCRHTVEETGGELLVEDMSLDSRFQNNPFVVNDPNIMSYMGVSLETDTGERIGTVCVFDQKTRSFTEVQKKCLRALAKYTMRLIQERVTIQRMEEQNKTLSLINQNLESFAYMVAHDVKAPIRIIKSFSKLILKDDSIKTNSELHEYLQFIHNSSNNLNTLVDNLLSFSQQVQIESSTFEPLDLKELIEETIGILDFRKEFLEYSIEKVESPLFFSELILKQSLQNIISNAIKYRDTKKEEQKLSIHSSSDADFHKITFKDNGIGMSPERIQEVFHLFNRDTRTKLSTGVGLSVVHELLKKVESEILIDSELKVGTTITLKIPRQFD